MPRGSPTRSASAWPNSEPLPHMSPRTSSLFTSASLSWNSAWSYSRRSIAWRRNQPEPPRRWLFLSNGFAMKPRIDNRLNQSDRAAKGGEHRRDDLKKFLLGQSPAPAPLLAAAALPPAAGSFYDLRSIVSTSTASRQ